MDETPRPRSPSAACRSLICCFAARPGPEELGPPRGASPRGAGPARRRGNWRGVGTLITGGTGSGNTTLLTRSRPTSRRGAGHHDRGRGRFRRAPAARCSSRDPPRERRGPRGGNDPRSASQRARMRPDRIVLSGRSGPGGARPADGAQHRARGSALDGTRKLSRGSAATSRDAAADGWCRPPHDAVQSRLARGIETWSSTWRARHGSRRVAESPRSFVTAAGSGRARRGAGVLGAFRPPSQARAAED